MILHVIPLDAEHIATVDCWCEPELDRVVDGNAVYVHRELH